MITGSGRGVANPAVIPMILILMTGVSFQFYSGRISCVAMRYTANVCTDVATIAAFDPVAIESLIRAESFDPNEWETATDECRMAMYLTGGDGTSVVVIYVNEEPREKPAINAPDEASGYLQVPSGTLCVTGAESIDHPDGATMTLAEYWPEMGDRFVIDPGWFFVRAFAVDTYEGPYNQHILAMLPKHQQDALKRNDDACLIGCGLLMYGAVGLLVAFILQFVVGGFRFWWVLLGVIAVWILYYLWTFVSPHQRAVKLATKAYAVIAIEHEGKFPSVVFSLTSINEHDIPEDAKGCRLERIS